MTLLEELETIGEWYDVLAPLKDELSEISIQLEREESEGRVIYPVSGNRLNALRHTQPGAISAVITGQDPYHGMKNGVPQAMGLSFSVPETVPAPPSLKNIQKELHSSLGVKPSNRGDLSRWAKEEGILLLNASLSVRESEPGSHAKIGWHKITQAILHAIDQQSAPVAFLAWGKHSHKLSEQLKNDRHCIIKTSHPSPLGARKSGNDFTAFLGSGCFAEANQFLAAQGRPEILWDN